MSDHLTGKDGSGDGSSEMADVEEGFHKSISTLISTMITEGAKIPGECGVVLMSSIIWLVPTLPLGLVLAPSIDLPLEKECKITLGNASRPFLAGSWCLKFPPQFTFNWGSECSHMATGRIHHQVWSGHVI